jgi:hypothetical protein
MTSRERDEYLRQFADGELQVLCACDILNEGWDCPAVEVLLMARPTLSRVIYLQQLGRGTRRAPGKECLIVFDFVDNASRYNQSLNLHRVLGRTRHRQGGFVLAPGNLWEAEEEALARGAAPSEVLEIGLWTRDYQEIDIFNWQQEVANMISITDLERELAVAEGRVRGAVERKQLEPDHTLELGERTYYYFDRDRIEEIRVAIGAPKLDDDSIRDRFLRFVEEMDMTMSYKPVMLVSVLDVVGDDGRAKLSDVVDRFRRFYQDRRAAGLLVERPTRRTAVDELDDVATRRLILEKPFQTFERRRFFKYDRDLANIRFDPRLWRQLEPGDLARVRAICQISIESYYRRIGSAAEAASDSTNELP